MENQNKKLSNLTNEKVDGDKIKGGTGGFMEHAKTAAQGSNPEDYSADHAPVSPDGTLSDPGTYEDRGNNPLPTSGPLGQGTSGGPLSKPSSNDAL